MAIITLDYFAAIKNDNVILYLLVNKDAYGILTNKQSFLLNFWFTSYIQTYLYM